MNTFGSLFAGIGGIDLGLEQAGWDCRWQVENDSYCNAVLKKHWPNVARYEDIRALDPSTLEPVDLVCGGYPCQPVSLAGARRGAADNRWLWPEFARVLRHLQPRLVLVENVPGLLTVNQGRAAQEVFGDLATLGYDAEWDCVPAALVGAPHRRYRVFIIAYADGERFSQWSERDGESQAGERSASRGNDAFGLREDVADAYPSRRLGWPRYFRPGWWSESTNGRRWEPEPDVGRVATGIPRRVDRLRVLGNAVVPQVAEAIGRMMR